MPIAALASEWSAESVIPPVCQKAVAAPLPAALPHTASSDPLGTFAGFRGPAWNSWRPGGAWWPGGTQLSAFVSLDHTDVWPVMVMNHINGSFLSI